MSSESRLAGDFASSFRRKLFRPCCTAFCTTFQLIRIIHCKHLDHVMLALYSASSNIASRYVMYVLAFSLALKHLVQHELNA